jgi:formylglycine-generating enzyme required for sulfatase activity
MKRSSPGRRVALLAGCAALALLLFFGWSSRAWIGAWYLLSTQFERLPENSQGFHEYRHPETGVIFVHLPGGRCLLGSRDIGAKPREPARLDTFRISPRDPRQPQREVTLAPFLVAKYELSQEVWTRVMGTQPSQFQGGELPVERVSWESCQELCARTGFDLPTPAQWEYACRSGTKTSFAFGEKISYDRVNYRGDRPSRHTLTPGVHRNRTLPVNSFTPNAFGIHNMHGNVWEWCRGPQHSKDQWVRGGSFFRGAGLARSSVGVRADRELRGHDIGMRPVYNLHQE